MYDDSDSIFRQSSEVMRLSLLKIDNPSVKAGNPSIIMQTPSPGATRSDKEARGIALSPVSNSVHSNID